MFDVDQQGSALSRLKLKVGDSVLLARDDADLKAGYCRSTSLSCRAIDGSLRGAEPRKGRRGITAVEILASLIVLLATVTLVTSLIFKCGMIWRDVSYHRVAVHELSRQLEELTLLDADSVKVKLQQLEPSPVCRERLPEAKLIGSMSKDNLGVRVQLSLNWKRAVESRPVVLCGWLVETEGAE
jgi:hypothetical protein